jgi:hypothetical protein
MARALKWIVRYVIPLRAGVMYKKQMDSNIKAPDLYWKDSIKMSTAVPVIPTLFLKKQKHHAFHVMMTYMHRP